jgi:hypothetical protein
VAVNEGEVLAVPASRLRELVARDQGIGDLILRAYLIRRSILIGLGAGLRIIGSRYSPDAPRVREPAGHLRRGRRAQRLGQAGRRGGRRGRDGHQARLRKNPAGIAGRRIPGREAQ